MIEKQVIITRLIRKGSCAGSVTYQDREKLTELSPPPV